MKFTSANARLYGSSGGRTTVNRHGREHMRAIGQRGFQRTVELHYGGDIRLFLNTLIQRGLMAQDPMPYNRAWTTNRIVDRLPTNYGASHANQEEA